MMNTGANDIVIKLHIQIDNQGIDAKKFIRILDSIEKALYKSDFEDVNRFYRGKDSFQDSLIKDAVLERLRSFRHKRLRLVDSKSGSIVLFGVVTAVSGFILQKTIGQAIEGGYRESQAYNEHKELFKNLFSGKYDSVRRNLRNVFIEDFDDEIIVSPETDDLNVLEINFNVDHEKDKKAVPSWDNIFNDFN